MNTRFQCDYCLHLMAMPDSLAGRKILCPMCGEPITIPAPDPARRFKKQDLADSIAKFQLSDWDRAIALAVCREALVEEKSLQKAIIETIKVAKRGPGVGLGEVLQQGQHLSSAQVKELRGRLRTSVGSQVMVLMECPNCFASVDQSLRACNYCGQRLGEVESLQICPACKHEQEKGQERCRRCMADMKTGIRPTQQRCPRCHELIMGAPEVCPSCQHPVSPSSGPSRTKTRGSRRSRRRVLISSLAVVLILLLLGWITGLFRILWVGDRQVDLEKRIDRFQSSLSENDLTEIRETLSPASGLLVDPNVRTQILSGKIQRDTVKKLKSFSVLSVRLVPRTTVDGQSNRPKEQQRNTGTGGTEAPRSHILSEAPGLPAHTEDHQAVVECETELVMVERSSANEKGSDELRSLFLGRTEHFRVIWEWQEIRGEWFFLRSYAKE